MLQTVDRALAVLQLLARSDNSLSMKAIAEGLDINLTSAYHLVNTLAARGFVIRRDGIVRLGAAATEIAAAYRQQNSISRDVGSLLDGPLQETGETTYLARWTGTNVVLQAVRESQESVRVAGLYVGYHGNELTRASGRSVLAFLPQRELDSYMKNLGSEERLVLDSLDLDRVLTDIRHQGYAVERGEFSPGAACVAAPFWEENGYVGGAIAISAPEVRFETKYHVLKDSVLRAADQATKLLSGVSASNVRDEVMTTKTNHAMT